MQSSSKKSINRDSNKEFSMIMKICKNKQNSRRVSIFSKKQSIDRNSINKGLNREF